jgi:hypothetical protein
LYNDFYKLYSLQVETTLNSYDLAQLFQSVADVLQAQRSTLNQADSYNANHGDHMVAIFQDAILAAQGHPTEDLAEAMASASHLLRQRSENGSAQVYAVGLEQFARQFREHQISLDDLVFYVQEVIKDDGASIGEETQFANTEQREAKKDRSGSVLKALLGGLAGWQKVESGEDNEDSRLGMGYLFEVGIAYMQAKQRGGSKTEIIADAAVSVCPFYRVPHRSQSGKIAIQALLQAMRAKSDSV